MAVVATGATTGTGGGSGSTTLVYASVSRGSLGLPDLNINDHASFILHGEESLFGSTVTWRRSQISSPYVESQFTVNRVRDIVQDKIAVDVLGPDQVTVQNNIQTLVTAMTQGYFNISVQLDAAVWTYSCEAADYTIDWTVGRMHSRYVLVTFMVLRSPVAINGV